MKTTTVILSFALILALAFSLTFLALPAKAQTSAETVIISNEFPGNSIVKLTNAGYGNDSVYQVLVDIQENSNPSISSAITPDFMTTLKNLPSSSAIFTTQFDYADINSAIAISTDGTVQPVTYTGSSYYNAHGTSSVDTQFSGLSLRTVYSSSQTPVVTFTMGTVTYNVIAIIYTPSTATATSNPTNTTPTASATLSTTPSTAPATPEFSTMILLPFALTTLFAAALMKRKPTKI